MDKKKTAFIGGTGYARDGKVSSEQYPKELQEWNQLVSVLDPLRY